MTIAKLARPEIRALKPYAAASQIDDTIRLNANEAPWTNRADRFRRPLNRYPEIRPARLRSALADRYGCGVENLLVTRGTSEGIDLLLRVFCRAGRDSMLIIAPTFSMYRHYAAVQGARVIEVETSGHDDFAVDIDALLESCDATTRLIFICSPNNPTGTSMARDELVRLLDARGDRSAIVVDEAYIEFAREPSVVQLLNSYSNLIVLRTLSKALAYAGARCGSVIGPAAVIDMLDAVQAPYAMATPVVECVENALQAENLNAAEQRVSDIVAERDRLVAAIDQFSFVRKIWSSAANFFLIEVDNVEALLEQCVADKILLRYFDGSLADCIRITVGSAAENDQLLQSFESVLNSSKSP